MRRYILKNGITLIHKKTESQSAAIEVMVKVGSNHEKLAQLGISHFLEHMLFEGTKKRKTSREITNEIEKLGGYFNAYTTTDRTAFHIKFLAKHFDKSLDVISDIIINSVFADKLIQKEKKVILKEIHMIEDDPRIYQWVLFQKNLFKQHPTRNPTIGTVQTVKALTRKDILSHYSRNYAANNIIISVVGGVEGIKGKIEKRFSKLKKAGIEREICSEEWPNIKKEKVLKKQKVLSSYLVLGYKVPPRLHRDSYTLDVIEAILGKGQSGRIFDEIRNKRGLSYEVSVNCETSSDYGFFAVQASVNKDKINLAKNIILREFSNLKNISNKEMEEATGFIEGSYLIENEDPVKMADELCFWEMIKDANMAESYIDKIKKVTITDVANAAKKYFNGNYTMAVIEPR